MKDSVSNPCFLDRRNKVNRSIYEYTLNGQKKKKIKTLNKAQLLVLFLDENPF